MARSIRISSLALAAALAAMALLAASASAEVLYSADADSQGAIHLPEEFTQLGSLVHLAGEARENPKVSLRLQTSEGEFTAPITLRVYAVEEGGKPGAEIAKATTEVAFSTTAVYSTASWTLTGKTLPSEAIVTLAFDATKEPDKNVEIVLAKPSVGTAAAPLYVATAEAPLEAGPEFGEGEQPAFTIEAEAPATLPPSGGSVVSTPGPTAGAEAATPSVTLPTGPPAVPAAHKMKLAFPAHSARLAGPGALVQVKCEGSAAARCMGTLTLSILGQTHKAPFSIAKGRKQYVVVPLGDDLERIDSLRRPRAVVTASTLQERGGSLRTERVLKLR